MKQYKFSEIYDERQEKLIFPLLLRNIKKFKQIQQLPHDWNLVAIYSFFILKNSSRLCIIKSLIFVFIIT